MIIAILNQKGGSGKTTIAVHVAAGLSRSGARVLLVDADPQASALDWAAARQGEPLFPVLGLPKPTLHRELPEVAADYAFTIIDGPPRVNDVARSAIVAADAVLVPVQPSPYDVWAAKEIVTLLDESPNDLQAAFIVSRKIVGTAIGRDISEALSTYPLRVLKSAISQRVAFAESAARGETVFETNPDSPASGEVIALVAEIQELFHGKKRSYSSRTAATQGKH